MTDNGRASDIAAEARPPAGGSPDGVAAQTVAASVKSLLPTGAFMTDDHRYYFNGEGPLPSVTTILETLDKPALGTWKAQQAVRLCHRCGMKAGCEGLTEDEAVKWALAEVRKSRDTAANVGSGVHHLADMLSRGHGAILRASR